MKIKKEGNTTKVWLSSRDTWRWANRSDSKWPCSTLSDRRIFVELDKNKDIIDIKINGKSKRDIDGHELSCLLKDLKIK